MDLGLALYETRQIGTSGKLVGLGGHLSRDVLGRYKPDGFNLC